ncbi:2-hydroxyacid dehydrogenase [Oricola sp.]|uniref:2-hydroxyacid dehydrogenase n=1 Tax=Oricola sp. TaxID=1979950 RepID=UPI003BA99F32
MSKGKILLAVTGFDPAVWRKALEMAAPDRTVVEEPDGAEDGSIDYAVVWKQQKGILDRLPNLKAVFSIGAGVDHIFAGGDAPRVPVVRVVAEDLTGRMSEYVAWQVLDHHRKGPLYRSQQARKIWHEDRFQPAAEDVTVGILGLGQLGTDAARKLSALGFRLAGWSRSPKTVDGVDTYAGDAGLGAFLAACDIVVCLLPLTTDTRGILAAPLFDRMKREGPLGAPVLINAGRGGLQNETDILAALDDGRLGAVSLDVFETEPLPADNPLWAHPKVMITPHAAATSVPEALVPPMIAQMDAHDRGEPLRDLVDPEAGY